MKFLLAVLVLLTGMCVISCRHSQTTKNDDNRGYANMQTTPSGLKFVDLQLGNGNTPRLGQQVTINYIMIVESNGKVIEDTYKSKKPFTFKMGDESVLKGLDEGVSTMRPGGKRKLFLIPELGYGNRNVGDVPANSTLEMDVELVSVK